jgi:hypothetical protein
MTDGKTTYSSQGFEIEEDDRDRVYMDALAEMRDDQLADEFRYWTIYDRRLQQLMTEINKRKENH